MTAFLGILSSLGAIFGAIHGLIKLFKKPTEALVESRQEKTSDEIEDFKNGARPKW